MIIKKQWETGNQKQTEKNYSLLKTKNELEAKE